MQAFSGSPEKWDELISALPASHLLQTWEWSQVKVKYGWQALPFTWHHEKDGSIQAAAMVLKRRIPIGGMAGKLCLLYIPKGPVMDWKDAMLRDQVLDDLQEFAKKAGGIFIKMDPDVELGKGLPGTQSATDDQTGRKIQIEMENRGWRFSSDQIQFRNTVLIDLSFSQEELLARMKQKTRYNLRLAIKKGVKVRVGTSADLPLLYRMYAETAVRDDFLIREEGYYQAVWSTFSSGSPSKVPVRPYSEPLVAEVEGKPVAAISIFYFADQAIYLFGMSRQEEREKMPNYLLQWQALLRAKELGCRWYNLWGAPDQFDESDRLWRVFRFKEGLGGMVMRTIGAWDYSPRPVLYQLYTRILPGIMDMMRIRGKARNRQALVST